MIALWKAYKSFEPTKGNLGTYLNFRIRYRLIDLLRKRARENEQIEQIIRDKITEIDGGHRYGLSKFPLVNQQGLPVSNEPFWHEVKRQDRKSTRLNYSHVATSYAVFCLKKKRKKKPNTQK